MHENVGERRFRQYAAQAGYGLRVIAAGAQETPDFEISTPAGPVICEVKHFPWSQLDRERAQRVGHFFKGHPGWTRLRDNALRGARRQLEAYRGQLTLALLVDTGHPFVSLDDDAILEAMFGVEKLLVWTDPGTGAALRVPYYVGHGRIRHPEHPSPWVSAVAVLERLRPHADQFDDLVEERIGGIPDNPGPAWYRRWDTAAQELRVERPDLDPELELLRMRVFENPEAERSLPRAIIAGPHDARYGASLDGRYGLIENGDEG